MLLYEKNYQLRVSDFDYSDNLRPNAVLDMFQSVASEHAAKLNIGYNDLLQKDSVWVLLRMRYDSGFWNGKRNSKNLATKSRQG